MTLSDTDIKWLFILGISSVAVFIIGVLVGYAIGFNTPRKRKIKKF